MPRIIKLFIIIGPRITPLKTIKADNANNNIEVQISSDQILSNSDVDNNCVTIENHDGVYAIKTISGYYIYATNSKNTILGSETYSSDCNIDIEMDATNVKLTASNNRTLMYNSNGSYIRFYTASNWGKSNYYKVSLYKLSE